MKSVAKAVYYTALDLCSGGHGVRRVIGGESVRFPARWSRYYPPDYEPQTFAFLRAHCKPGQTVFDVGAHLGLFSVVMARMVGPDGQVIAFEPAPQTREVLQETVQLNGCGGIVEVRAEAMSQTRGTATFYETGDAGSNANSLVHTARSKSGFTVQTTSLDEFISARGLSIDCLKIDVEGAELDVLRGAEQTFAARPAAALSLHPRALRSCGAVLSEIWEVLRAYRMSVLHHGNQVDQSWFCSQDDLFDVCLLPGD